MPNTEQGAGKIKAFLSVAGTAAAVVGNVAGLSDTAHAMLSTAVFVFFMIYVVTDMLWWRGYPAVWIFGPITIAVAAYWWIGFLAKHNVPSNPLLPAHLYPPDWAYIAMFGWLALYCAWDIIDARANEYRDEKTLVAGAVVLLLGAAVCLFLTLRGPQGA